jgi:tetratricopeptide (TPR) repeat protein
MRKLILLTAVGILTAATLATAAQAANVIVIGRTIGRECYEDTLLDPTPENSAIGLSACNRAVKEESEDMQITSLNLAADYENRSDIEIRLGKYDDAIKDAEAGLSLHAKLPVAHLNRGAALIGLGRYAEAQAELDQAISQRVELMQLAYFDRGLARESQGDVQGAYQDYKQAATLDPDYKLAADQLTRFTVVKKDNP